MNNVERILAVREGGQTIRAHIMPYVGTYNVAIHSFNALNLLLQLYPGGEPPLRLIKAVQWHDVAERWTGDVPKTAKMASKELKMLLGSLEIKINLKLGIQILLTDEEEDWLHAVDLLELFIWSKEQLYMGNNQVKDMSERILEIFDDMGNDVPEPIMLILDGFEFKRTVECHELLNDIQN